MRCFRLRLRVWKFAKPGPRIVKIASVGKGDDSLHIYKNMTRPPGPLFACHESRVEYLKWYREILHEDCIDGEDCYWDPSCLEAKSTAANKKVPSAVYFDPGCDAFEFPGICILPDYKKNSDIPRLVRRFDHLMGAGHPSEWITFRGCGIKKLRFDITNFTRGDSLHLLRYSLFLFRRLDTVTFFFPEDQPVTTQFSNLQKVRQVLRMVNKFYVKRSRTGNRTYQEVPYDKEGKPALGGKQENMGGDIRLILEWA